MNAIEIISTIAIATVMAAVLMGGVFFASYIVKFIKEITKN